MGEITEETPKKLKMVNALKPQEECHFEMSVAEYNEWEEKAMSWCSMSNLDSTPPKTQKVFFRSIVHDNFWLSISEQMKARTTFQDCINYGRKAYNMSKKQICLNKSLARPKEREGGTLIHLSGKNVDH